MAEEAEQKVDKEKILVVIDMQNDFITGSLGNKDCEDTVIPVVQLVNAENWGRIYMTMDTHSDHYMNSLEGTKLPVEHCIADTDGWKIQKDVIDAISNSGMQFEAFEKTTFGSDTLARAVKTYLGMNHIHEGCAEIHVCGLCTSICVLANVALLRTALPNARIYVHINATADVTIEMKAHGLFCLQALQCDIVP